MSGASNMCSCGSGSSGICPCDQFVHPQIISNLPGRETIVYRVGDYVAFREALLRSRPGEFELLHWRPGATGDLAVQMVEWWAYLTDILTFYNERIANEDYLRTAILPESVQGLIRLLGYRPRPGIGATGTLAALMSSKKPLTLPLGFQIQSKPGPGKQPQIFELDAQTSVQKPDILAADPPPTMWVQKKITLLLKGTVRGIKTGDQLLLMERNWKGQDNNYIVAHVLSTSPVKDPSGATNTSVTLDQGLTQLAGGSVQNYRLVKAGQSSHVWQYPASAGKVIQPNNIDLDAIARGIKVGDPVLFSGANSYQQLLSVTSYTELVWFADPGGGDPATPPPASPPSIAIPITHTSIGFANTALSSTVTDPSVEPTERTVALVSYGWKDVGTLIAFPAASLTGTQISLRTPLPASALPMTDQEILVGDANGNGADAAATAGIGDPLTIGLSSPAGPSDSVWASSLSAQNLQAPLNVLFDLLKVSRGKTVASEVLGSGDATITTGQQFVLQKSPLTYLQSSDSTSGAGYKSTLQVWVDGVKWQEASSFYDQKPDAHIFVTREDEKNVTHVQFGDGVNGARLPSGTNNVLAAYRYGSGAESPDPGSLTVILKPWPGLKSILNPVPAGGGADPDPPQQIKKYAPQSVLTFGRAVSADDYEVIAAQAPGVARARSYWTWDDAQQRMLVKIYVGDDQNAVGSANTALAGASDPNRPLRVIPAQSVPVTLSLTLVVDPKYVLDDVKNAATASLVDADQGLLGLNVIQIGQSIFESQIYQACLKVAGVMAVHNLTFSGATGPSCSCCASGDYRFDPGEGGFFSVTTPADQIISPEVGNAN